MNIKLLCLGMFAIASSAYAQDASKAHIALSIEGLPDSTRIEASLACTHKDEKPLATAFVINGKAAMDITIGIEPRYINIRPSDFNNSGNIRFLTANGDNVNITAEAQKQNNAGSTASFYVIENPKVNGSQSNDEYVQLMSCTRELDSLYTKHRNDNESIRKAFSEAYYSKDSAKIAQIEANPEYQEFQKKDGEFYRKYITTFINLYKSKADSWWGPFLMLATSATSTNYAGVYNEFSDEAKNSFYGKILNDLVIPPTFEGKPMPQLTATTKDGETVNLSNYYANKKLVLVDFWASWCGPCRQEIPNVKALYSKYAAKGLEIVSISLDRDKNKWLEASEKENFPWINLLDRNGAADKMKVRYIPSTFLVDVETGNCILQDMRGEHLENRIAEILK